MKLLLDTHVLLWAADDFAVHPHRFRTTLLDHGYVELPVTAEHALALGDLPALHRDPFDRMLLAHARHEGAILVTADHALARYPVPVRLVCPLLDAPHPIP